MIENFKNNTKIKLISLLSSLVLWLYVMAFVDPEETKLFEGMPIIIKNMSELRDKDLVIYPELDLTTDISVSGKLSKLQKVKRDNIHISGEINNPMEGKNDIYLKADTPGQVTNEFKNNIVIVNLEKLVSEKKTIEIQLEGKSIANVHSVMIENDIDSINVSGPRTKVNEVEKIVGVVDVGANTSDFSNSITLIPIDKEGNEVEDIELEYPSVTVNVGLLKEKKVPIKLKLEGKENIENNLKDYTLNPVTIMIKGKKDKIDKVDYIETEAVNVNDFISSTSKDIGLIIPDGISSDVKYISVKLNTVKLTKESFEYTKEEIDIRNNDDNIDLTTINIPNSIGVTIEYLENIGVVTKSDIVLYIDLSQELSEDGKYDIKYDTEYELKNIIIKPDKIQ